LAEIVVVVVVVVCVYVCAMAGCREERPASVCMWDERGGGSEWVKKGEDGENKDR
jgi:hypothetical protein